MSETTGAPGGRNSGRGRGGRGGRGRGRQGRSGRGRRNDKGPSQTNKNVQSQTAKASDDSLYTTQQQTNKPNKGKQPRQGPTNDKETQDRKDNNNKANSKGKGRSKQTASSKNNKSDGGSQSDKKQVDDNSSRTKSQKADGNKSRNGDEKQPKGKDNKSRSNDSGRGNKGGNQKQQESEESSNKEKPKGATKSKQNKGRANNNQKKISDTGSAPLSPSVPPSQPQQTSDINYGRGDRITVLHVAEKPSIGEAIARGLCKGSSNKSTKILPVHDFTTPSFPKAPHVRECRHRVTSVAGHVFSIDFPQEYQSWDSVDPAELFGAPTKQKPTKGSIVKHLQDQARGVDFIVLWMDGDREGENINFEVLDTCMHLMKAGGGSNYNRVYRAFFSAINPSDIQKAYNALGKPDKNQSLSVEARQELDLKVGVAFSRFQTRFFQGRYGDLDSSVLSYGPCQTPTLGFCVQRHIDIETFKPEPYWTLDLAILKRGRKLQTIWGAGRSFNKGKVEGLVTKCAEEGAKATVTNVVKKEKKQGRPTPLNTVALLKACSKALGIGPHNAMQTAERLYLSGYLSYPRTESTAYPKSFDIKGTLQEQASDGRWGSYVRNLVATGHNKARGGVDHGDHPPITPCRAGRDLSGDMGRIYDLVVRHFIATVSEDAVFRSTRVDFAIETLEDQGTFTLSGKELVSPGFLEILLHKEYGDSAEDDGEEEEVKAIPEFFKGEVVPLMHQEQKKSTSGSTKIAVTAGAPCWGTLGVKEKMTTPPGYLTESELISKMEKHGIGTDASIPTHIENILKRNYTTLETGRRLIPSKLGLVLVQGYHQIDSGLVLPKVRSDIEDQCSRIAKGLAHKDDVVKKALELFRSKFDYFVKNISRMDVLFGSSFSKLEDVGKPFTRCGLTRRYLQYIPGPPVRLYNKYTETVYPLPGGGEIKQWSGRKCTVPDCNFELCLYETGNPARTFPLCPRCFNSAEWSLEKNEDDDKKDAVDREDENKERQIQRVAGRNLILECPLPDSHPLVEELTVSPDPDSDGVLTLDPHFGPKWRLVSTRDPTIVYLPKSISKITILNQRDEVLGCRLMKIEFKAGESPLPDGQVKYTSCFPTDELLQGMVRVYHGSERLKAKGRGGRGRGGRGRGGRGRGGRGRGGRWR